MKTYSVNYTHSPSKSAFVIENLIADGFVPESGHRFFVEQDGTRWEIPTIGVEFCFSKERSELINDNLEAKRNEEQAFRQHKPAESET